MSPTLKELEDIFQTTLEIGDLVKDQRGYYDQITEVGLEIKHGRFERRLFGDSSPAVKLEEIDITGPQKHKKIVAKSGPHAGVEYQEIIKASDRVDPWAPK